MIKEVIKYIDFNGEECEDTLYFNLTKREAAMLMAKYAPLGGLEAYIEKLRKEKNLLKIMELVCEFCELGYGQKSVDGKRFVKNAQITEDFVASVAYSELFEALMTEEERSKKFFVGMLSHAVAAANQQQSAVEALKPVLKK